MGKTKFTRQENIVLTEIYRRLNFFHNSFLKEPLLLLARPAFAKPIVKLGIIISNSKEIPNATNWYHLTVKGRELFKHYRKVIGDEENLRLATGKEVIQFDYKLLPKE